MKDIVLIKDCNTGDVDLVIETNGTPPEEVFAIVDESMYEYFEENDIGEPLDFYEGLYDGSINVLPSDCKVITLGDNISEFEFSLW